MTAFENYSDSPENIGIHPGAGVGLRYQVVLLLDCSTSMTSATVPREGESVPSVGTKFTAMCDGLSKWVPKLREDPRLEHALDLAVITFGPGGVQVHRTRGDLTEPATAAEAFSSVGLFGLPVLGTGGVTPMVEAIRTALEVVRIRKTQLIDKGLQYYRPMIWMLSDGEPTDDRGQPLGMPGVADIAKTLRDQESRGMYLFFAVDVGGADQAVLEALGGANGAVAFEGTDWLKLFMAISNSMHHIGSQKDISELKRQMVPRSLDQLITYLTDNQPL